MTRSIGVIPQLGPDLSITPNERIHNTFHLLWVVTVPMVESVQGAFLAGLRFNSEDALQNAENGCVSLQS